MSIILTNLLPDVYAVQQLPVQHSITGGITTEGSPYLKVNLKLDEGWKVYAPAPPEFPQEGFSPSLSLDLGEAKIHWPEAYLFPSPLGDMIGYEGEITLPALLTFSKGPPKTVRGKLNYLMCRELCIPVQKTFEVSLTPTSISVDNLLTHTTPDFPKVGESLAWILLLAFLGGLILNIMPCVLPVLGLKINAFVRGQEGRIYLLWTFVGILISFLILASLTLLLQSLGHLVGWGFHFQNPTFIGVIIVMLTLFALNFLGKNFIQIPSFLSHSLLQVESRLEGAPKAILMGGFATLLATPCTAPFLGTAIGYTVTTGTPTLFLVFLTLGFGFGFPYLIALLVPTSWISTRLKAGRWSNAFKNILGLLLAGSALWFLSVFQELTSTVATVLLATSLVLLISLFTGHRKSVNLKSILVLVLFFSYTLFNSQTEHIDWKPFEESKIQTLVDQGKTVFVDVTAIWCLTCQMNKLNVLNTQKTHDLFKKQDVYPMQADWTKKDATIFNFLKKHHRLGVPLNVVYSPRFPQGKVLSEVLTFEEVQKVVGNAEQ